MTTTENYITSHTTHEDPLLAELERETQLKKIHPRMLSGHVLGKVLEFLSRMLKPENILEIGTFTGYSALCLAKGLKAGGSLHTIEVNDEHETMILKYFNKSEYTDSLNLHIGKAEDIIPKFDTKFDLVFIDAEKCDYLTYYKLIFDKLKVGGYIIADNIFWDMKVLKPTEKNDYSTEGIKKFNDFVQNDKLVENVMVPVRDGIYLIRKIGNKQSN